MNETALSPFARWPFAASTSRVLSALVFGALALRCGLLLLHPGAPIEMDGAEYARGAQTLLHGDGYGGMRGFTELTFPPLYSLLIAALSLVVGRAEVAGRAISIVSGALLVVPVFLIARLLYGVRTAFVAGVIIAIVPIFAELSVQVLSEPLYTTFAMFGVYFSLVALRAPSIRWGAGAGLSFGAAYLVRPEALALVFTAAVLLSVLAIRRGRRAGFTPLLALVLIFGACASPYVAFESWHTGKLSFEGKSTLNYLISRRLRSGMNYWLAADEVTSDLRQVGPEIADRYYVDRSTDADPPILDEVRLGAAAVRYHVGLIARDLAGRPFASPLLLALAAFGLVAGPWTQWRRRYEVALLAFVGMYAIVLGIVWFVWPRYVAFFVPFIVLWAARGIVLLDERFANRRRIGAGTVALAVYALVCASAYVSEARQPYSTAERRAGTWLGARDGGRKRVMETTDLVSFYSGAIWRPLPYAPAPTALAYIAHDRPDYVVLSGAESVQRNYVGTWLKTGLPARDYHKIFTADRGAWDEIELYERTDRGIPVAKHS